MEQYKLVLQKYLPRGTEEMVISCLQKHRVHLHVTKSRLSKLGDFRPPGQNQIHKITVNYNLNPYAFLITLLHEIAHVEVWQQFKHSVKPHGREWKRAFGCMLGDFLDKGLFPADVETALSKHASRPLASSGADLSLARVLRQYDRQQDLTLEDLPARAVFRIHNGKLFRKLEKERTRYRCLCLDNNKIYRVHPFTSVQVEDK